MELEGERELVERAKTDPQAFGILYDEYFSQIFGYILRRTASIPVAQDVTAEVFFKALRSIKGFQWRGIPFSDWLYRIAIHEIANFYTHNGHNRVLTDEMKHSLSLFDASVETGAEEAEARLQQESDLLTLHKSITKLTQKYQEVITLRFFEKKQINQIAAILGKREGTIKSLLHRGLERLRVLMEDTNATF